MIKHEKKTQRLYVKIGDEWYRLRKTVKQIQRSSEIEALRDSLMAEDAAKSMQERLQQTYQMFLKVLHFGLNPDYPEKEDVPLEKIERGMDADEIERAGYAYLRYFMDPSGDPAPFVVQTD
jgi:cell fate (sporulation/competence/biofilm development) regulator YlbF (YheA/YmcA/DUF963 family)